MAKATKTKGAGMDLGARINGIIQENEGLTRQLADSNKRITELQDALGKLEEVANARADLEAIGDGVLTLPFAPLAEGAPISTAYPWTSARTNIRFSAARMRKLAAIHAGLTAAGATLTQKRGTHSRDVLINGPCDVLLWMLDHVELASR